MGALLHTTLSFFTSLCHVCIDGIYSREFLLTVPPAASSAGGRRAVDIAALEDELENARAEISKLKQV